mmetsp:Transcript_34456/g.88129  ORF Transcript_34456/g.88129 Transcript_34456/m.88129 type:complete len:140 (+) Transcript_34456:1443-1862(+)
MQALLKRLQDIDPTLESLKLDSSSINKHPELRRVIYNHTIGGPYMRQYFKQPLVDDCQCKACQLGLWGVLRLPAAAYADIVNHKVPLPIPEVTSDSIKDAVHYMPFEEAVHHDTPQHTSQPSFSASRRRDWYVLGTACS